MHKRKNKIPAQRHLRVSVSPWLLLFFLAFPLARMSAASPQRIVSISPGFTETLYALGLDREIVGTTNFCDYPEKAKHTEKIGDLMTPNLEKIISLHPDLVICGQWKWQLPENLRKVGLRVVEIPDSQTLEDTFHTIQLIGESVGRKEKAAQLVSDMKTRLEKLKQKHSTEMKHTVYVELDSGNWTAGGASYLNELLQTAGLTSIFAERKEPYLMVTMESILSRNPDLFISLAKTKEDISASVSWQSLKAVRTGMILDKNAMDWNSVTRQTPRMIEGTEKLEQLVSDLFHHKGAHLSGWGGPPCPPSCGVDSLPDEEIQKGIVTTRGGFVHATKAGTEARPTRVLGCLISENRW
jgi:iron complex transport system substrate-binding protein